MNDIQHEFDRLTAVFRALGFDMTPQPPASESEIAAVLETTGVHVDDAIKSLWRLSNGSGQTHWFVQGEDDLTPYIFHSTHTTLDCWRMLSPYDARIYDEWYDDEKWGKRDSRIQRHKLANEKWIALAEFGGGSDVLYFDADPTAAGNFGQLINYVHDPDGVFWLSSSFLEYFVQSNDILEEALRDNPECLAQQLWLRRPDVA